MSIAWRSFDILFCLCVCAYVFLSRTVCMYWDVHEACQLMDIFVNTECNVIVFSLCSFSLLLFLFFTGCSLLSGFFPTPTSSFFPHSPSLCLLSPSRSFCVFLSVLCLLCFLFYPRCFCLFGSFPSSPYSLPLPPSPAGRGCRKLVDCPQLLDVDDMVKMREPDWKCVYTYLQEFYRGLVTKGLVKTKNSS